MDKKISISDILAMKNQKKIVMITAYDALFTKIFDEFVDMILVGDSLNMSFAGKSDTLSLSLEDMIYHTKVVKNAAKKALVVADMPFGYTNNAKEAIKNCVKIYKESGADAIKIECNAKMAPIIKELSEIGIATIAHIGLRPQQVRFEGGYKIKGKDDKEILLENAKILSDAGAFCVLIEGTLSEVASQITKSIKVPTIGIGCGNSTDGQVLVWSDMLGFFDEFKPKFVKRYLEGAKLVRNAVSQYANEVRNGEFPTQEFEYKK